MAGVATTNPRVGLKQRRHGFTVDTPMGDAESRCPGEQTRWVLAPALDGAQRQRHPVARARLAVDLVLNTMEMSGKRHQGSLQNRQAPGRGRGDTR